MECFNGFWSRRVEEERTPACDHPPCPLPLAPPEGYRNKTYRWYLQYIVRKQSTDIDQQVCEDIQHPLDSDSDTMEDFESVKQIIKSKAEKHSEFYKNLLNEQRHLADTTRTSSESSHREIERESAQSLELQNEDLVEPRELQQIVSNVAEGSKVRQRRTGVVQMHQELQQPSHKFPRVDKFVEQYNDLIYRQMDKFADKKDTLLPPTSGYCSSSNTSDDEGRYNVKRCCSSDSAVGLLQSDEDVPNPEELEEPDIINELYDEVPHYYPTSKRGSIDHCNVPSKTLIEAHIVPFPLDRKQSDCESIEDPEKFASRRQSCFTDDGEEPPRYRYWRTPSVVVSDYSDDVIGGFFSYEELEYFRNQRKDLSSPDSSLNSSCSNLNYCGSSVSVLDEFSLRTPSRKASDCSTCSTISGDEEFENHLQPLTTTVYGNKGEATTKSKFEALPRDFQKTIIARRLGDSSCK